MKRTINLFTALLLVAFSSLPAGAEEQTITFTPDQTRIDWTLDATGHDVEGSFRLLSGSINWDPVSGAASGTIEIDATSARTGNKSRDSTMHEDVLESGKYPRFAFKPSRVEGTVKEAGTSAIRLHGVLSIHGAIHPFVLPAEVEMKDGTVQVKTSFAIPFVKWGMKDPSILFLRVAKEVKVDVSASATVTSVVAGDGH